MSGMFIARITPATVATVARELIQLQCNASAVMIIHEAQISGLSTASQVFNAALAFAATTNGPGTTFAPQNISQAGATAASTAYGIASSNATGLIYLDSQAVNVLSGYHFLPTPELRPVVKPGGRIVLRVDSTHTDDFVADAWIKFEEKGN